VHASLRTEHGLELMASDGHDPDAGGPDEVSLSLSGDDQQALSRWLEAQAAAAQG
jgi:PhnB protein